MSSLDLLKATVVDNCTLFGFEYNEKFGNVDPYWEDGTDHFLLHFDGYEQVVHTFDEVLSTPFINGMTLSDLLQAITVTDC